MKKPAALFIFSSTLLLFIGCNRERLPESYGVYIRDQGTLTKIDSSTPEEKRRNFSPAAEIIIFNRNLALLGLGGSAEKELRILPRKFERFHVILLHDSPTNAPSDIILTPINEFRAFNPAIACAIMPVKGWTEMIKIKPQAPLANGLYYADVGGERLPFGIGIGTTAEKDSPLAHLSDCFVDKIDPNANFSWDNWLAGSVGKLNGQDGTYYEASKLQQMLDERKERFEQLNRDGKFRESSKLLPLLSAFYGTGEKFTNQVTEPLEAQASAKLHDDPQGAVVLAHRILGIKADDEAARQIVLRGTKALNDWNQEEAAKQEKDARRYEAWWKRAHEGTPLFVIPFYTTDNVIGPPRKTAKWTITKTGIVDEWQDGWGTSHRIDLWFGDKFAIKSDSKRYNSQTENLRMQTYYELELIGKTVAYGALFDTEQDEKNAEAKLRKAIEDFTVEFSPESNARTTAGTVRRGVRDESATYSVDLMSEGWSPPIHVPAACRSWRWEFEGNACPFEIQMKDGMVLQSSQPLQVDGNSDLHFRARSDVPDGQTPWLTVIFDLD